MISSDTDPQLAKLRAKLDELEQVIRSNGESAGARFTDQARSEPIGTTLPSVPMDEEADHGRRGGAGSWLWRLLTGQR